MVGYETSFQLRTTISLWKYPLWHVGSVLNRPEFTAVLSETSWSSLFHGQNHAWQWNLQAIILCSPANFWIPDLHRSTQIYTDAAVTAVALVPWQMPIRKRHIQNRQGTMPGATETAGSHDFPWRNAWRLKDSLKEKLSKAMSLPSSLTLCSDSLKLSQTQMSFHDFTRKVFGKANFSLLRVKQMRLHVPFWTWRGKHSHLIMAKFLERSKYWPDISATDFVQEGNCLKPGASSLTLIGHLIQDCLPSWRLDFVKDIQAEGPVSSTTTCSQEPGAVHTAWQILQTSASQGIQ